MIRIQRILNHLNKVYVQGSYAHATEYTQELVEKGKVMSERHLLPLYITLKATLIVSKEMLMETLAQRLGDLKMTYEVSKDTVTMFVTGDFSEQKIISKIESNVEAFKDMTVKFIQKGLEIKISRKELFTNYELVVLKLS